MTTREPDKNSSWTFICSVESTSHSATENATDKRPIEGTAYRSLGMLANRLSRILNDSCDWVGIIPLNGSLLILILDTASCIENRS
jgi:hypothetical protein